MGLMKRLLEDKAYANNARRKREQAGAQNFAPEVNIEYMSYSLAHQRRMDKDSLDKFNADMMDWAKKVEGELKAAAPVKHGVLQKSIKATRALKQGETSKIGFRMARHGAYIFQGAGRGYAGDGTSKWYNTAGKRVSANPDSIGRLGSRRTVDWFNPVIQRNEPELVDIIHGYASELMIDVSRLYMI